VATALAIPFESVLAGLSNTRPAFGRAEVVALSSARDRNGSAGAARELRILLVKNPAGANEVLRTLALEPGEHDLLGVLNDQIADGRGRVVDLDADFELLAGRARRFTCSGTRAAELATRIKYAGVDVERIVVEPDLRRALDAAAASQAETQAPLYALPTYTAMLALRELLVARGELSGRMVVSHASPSPGRDLRAGPTSTQRAVVWHDLECGGYRVDMPAWLELAERAGGPVLDVGAGTGRVSLALARAGHAVTAVDRDQALLDALGQRVAGMDNRDGLCRRADARPRRAQLRAVRDADADDPAARRR